MPRLLLITADRLDQTNRLLARACAARGIDCVSIDPLAPGHARPAAGDLLYCAAASVEAQALERRWWRPAPDAMGVVGTVGTVHGDGGPDAVPDRVTLDRLGLRLHTDLPRDDPGALLQLVDGLGGFPVVLKVPGGEGGRGVMRADSAPALLSLLDYLPADTLLLEYFPHVLGLRLVVVGGAVVATEAWCPPAWDFRTNAGGVSLGPVAAPDPAQAMALQACVAMGLHFGGVDILQDEAGELRLAEVNCPCHFAALQAISGVDIAGQLVDLLLARAGGAATTPR